MAIGINPMVDFAFKIVFGSPERPAITVHFLNAVLGPSSRISRVTILNPNLDKETEDGKLSVLDVLAEDEHGRKINIEMQTAIAAGLPQRLAYYASTLYVAEAKEGLEYSRLRPAVSICVLKSALFPQVRRLHLDFRLRGEDGLLLTDDLQIHLVELAKSLATRDNISKMPPLERWAFFLRNAERLSMQEVERLLPEPEFLEAAGVLDMIARTPEMQWLYDARRKFELDAAARLEYALQQGMQQGMQEGLAKGRLIGQISLLQELLGEAPISAEELANLDHAALITMAGDLHQRIRGGESS